MMIIQGRLVDILGESINAVQIVVEEGIIQSVSPADINAAGHSSNVNAPGYPSDASGPYILPGFIDAHVHIESSLLIPSEFARLAVVHGTIGTVSDPHEIANVCGLPGVEFMIRNGHTVPFYFFFGAPSCVPATGFETAGATLDAAAVTQLLEKPEIGYLSELMNFPGVLHHDPEVMAKIAAAHRLGKPVDGHAPGLRGDQARAYIAAGISTDHECFTAEEALEKLQAGMKILIREGSAARNFDALIDLLNDWPEQMMFCSDDKHPDSLLAGHINNLCARAVAKGIDLFKILRAACLNPVEHYKLPTGRLRPGDPADFIIVEDLQHFKVLQTYIKGQLVAQNGHTHLASTHLVQSTAPASSGSFLTASPINNFKATPRDLADFAYPLDKWGEQENVEQCYCIEALDGQLITNKLVLPIADVLPREGRLHSNPEKDILKIVVVNRYHPAPVAKSFIKNFGLKRGAIASSVAHDSHNIVAVGVDDESICRAVNLVIANKGGLSCVDATAATTGAALTAAPTAATTAAATAATTAATTATAAPSAATAAAATGRTHPAPSAATSRTHPAPSDISGEPIPLTIPSAGSELILPLPVAGLMSLDDGFHVADQYIAIDNMAKELGSTLAAPFMTLSFMALLVIPHLKLSDLGLFDGDRFTLV